MRNQPYVKQYNEQGLVSNPITKDNPFINHYEKNRGIKTRFRGNNKGNAIVVVGNIKYFKVLQILNDRTIEHSLTKYK